MRTSKEERDDLRARCRAGVIAITTDAALVAALVDDVEELDALVDAGARAVSQMAQDAAAEVDRLRAERDARPEIQPSEAECIVAWMDAAILDGIDEAVSPPPWVYRVRDALRAHAGKVAR